MTTATTPKASRSKGKKEQVTENASIPPASEATPVAESNEPQKIETVIGDYKIIVEGTKEAAIARVIGRGTDIILDKEFHPTNLEVIGNTKKLDALENAKLEAIAAYHQAVDTVDGLIDLTALIEHPLNSLVYGEDEKVDDLVKLLEEKDGQVFKLIINEKGQALSGNRRIKAAAIVNQRCIEEGQPPKFEFVPVEVKQFDSIEAEFKYMILQNQGRKKTQEQLKREAKNLVALATSSAIPAEQRMGSPEMIERLRESLGGETGKATRSTAFNAQKALKAVETYQDQELKSQIETLAVTLPNKAKELVEAAPPKTLEIGKEAYQAKVLERIKANPTESVKRASQAINRELATEQLNEANGVSQDDIKKLIEAAKAAGDKGSDNRKTPKEYIGLAFDTLRSVDLDSFAMLTDRDYIGAAKSYTILDNAFNQDHRGNVFANPPYSLSSEAIALFDQEICNGHIQRLFLILPVSVQSTKAYHKLVKDHNPLILQPNKRLAFEPGELLLAEDPQATADGNREPSVIIYWSVDETDYPNFYDCAINYGWVARQYAPFNPYQLPKVFANLKWEETDKVTSANVFGATVAITQTDNGYVVSVNGEEDPDGNYPSFDSAKRIGIMNAIASLSPATPF